MKPSKFGLWSINLGITASVCYLLVSYMPIQPNVWFLVIAFSMAITFIQWRNVTSLKKIKNVRTTEQEREEREFTIYRDVMSSVTQDKLLLAYREEIYHFVSDVSVHADMQISNPYDVAKARNLVRSSLENLPITKQRKTHLVLCVSEAVTNVVKHSGNGKLVIFTLPECIRIWIQDTGPGIEIKRLPMATLRKGYSTKLSLGCGFSIMLDYLDRLIISTKGSTILILEMKYADMPNEAATEERVTIQHAG